MDDEENKLPCADKIIFDSFGEAEGAALAADWQHGAQLKPYQCQYCDLWHLASN